MDSEQIRTILVAAHQSGDADLAAENARCIGAAFARAGVPWHQACLILIRWEQVRYELDLVAAYDLIVAEYEDTTAAQVAATSPRTEDQSD